MNIFEKIAEEAVKHLPVEDQARHSSGATPVIAAEAAPKLAKHTLEVTEYLASACGLAGRSKLLRLCRIAGWDLAKTSQEIAVPGFESRFRQAVERGHREAAWREETAALAILLRTGPLSLAGCSVDNLAAMARGRGLGAIARDYDPLAQGSRLVLGPTGIGKSAAGVAVLRRLLGIRPHTWPDECVCAHHGRRALTRVAYVRALDLPNARLAHGLGQGEAELVTEAKSAPFLVFDDIGWESARANAADVVVEVVSHRYDHGRPTYATTGLHLREFVQRYGEAVVRKLTEARGLPGCVLDCWPEAA